MCPLVTPRFTRASASQLKWPLISEVSWCLKQEQAIELFGKEAERSYCPKRPARGPNKPSAKIQAIKRENNSLAYLRNISLDRWLYLFLTYRGFDYGFLFGSGCARLRLHQGSELDVWVVNRLRR